MIGAGAMASVYRATVADGATVAVKVLNPAQVLPEDVVRFKREFQALAQMAHPNVVRVYEAGVADGYPWIAMEWVDGHDLGSHIAEWTRNRPADLYERIDRLLRGLCRGLQYIHDRGLVHRDVKPSNILVDAAGEPKLTDFGVVKGDTGASHQTQLTMAGRLVGTVAFMAPELITEEGIDARVDLYALGACLYLMLTGARPIEADSVAGYLARHLTEVPTPPNELVPDTPRRLERIAMRLLRKDRAHRYPSGLAVLQALDRPDDSEPLPLRGRDLETAAWTRRLAALCDGAGGVLALSGPAGSGRTHLLHTMVDQARVSGVRAAWATASEADPEAQLARGLGLAESASAAGLVSSAGGVPTVLAVDDADLLTADARDALAKLIRARVALEADRLLLVLAVADPDGPTATLISGHATGLAADRIPLPALPRQAVVAMLRDRQFKGPVAAALGRRLHADYDGWPGPILDQMDALVAAGWFRDENEAYVPTRSLDAFRRDDLPVPDRTAVALRGQLSTLGPAALDAAALLATLDHPSSASLLGRCVKDRQALARALDELVRAGLAERAETSGQDRYRFTHPCLARVIRHDTPPDQRRALHTSIAVALAGGRRRSSALELAFHQEAAGDPTSAYPNYLQAARRAARSGRTTDVLDIVARAERVRGAAEASLDPRTAAGQHRWLRVLEGEALLDRREYAAAEKALRAGLEAARDEPDQTAVPRCLGALGRTSYRLGKFDEAEALLRESMAGAEAGSTERARAGRALADIRIRRGDVETAERLFTEVLEIARQTGSRDSEARARRGIGHVRAVQGRLKEALELLAHAEELLSTGGEPAVRAGVLLRLIEIDIATGRFGSALYRSEHLVELIRRQALSDRLPSAYALLGATLAATGDRHEAYDAVCQARVYARASRSGSRFARLRIARVLADLSRFDEALEVLPEADQLIDDAVHDASAQRAALSARCWAPHDPARAADQAVWALVREPPLFPVAAGWICRDAAAALNAIGQPTTARKAAKQGLKRLQGTGADGVRLELLGQLYRSGPGPKISEAARPLLERVRRGLHGTQRTSFDARPDLAFLR
ncbi:MAG: tetratricopeptide (TPR) repeat protein [Myxococcota bacterium]|jgi:tetratricopeptide (TPR) repeat protein